VVDRRQYAATQRDPMDLAPALNPMRVAGWEGRDGRYRAVNRHHRRRQSCGDERMQPIGRDQPSPQ
jgi:hypothetical protein